jgi:hypothetical protein
MEGGHGGAANQLQSAEIGAMELVYLRNQQMNNDGRV